MLTAMFMSAVTVVMMPMMVTMCIRIILQISFGQSLCCIVRRALNSCIKFDSGICERHLCTHTNSSTDQNVCFYCLQKSSKCAVSASIGIYDLLIHDLSTLYVEQLELLCMAEVLEDFSVFIGYCDSHGILSFLNNDLFDFNRFKFTMPACDQQPFSVHKSICDLFSCAVINGCDSSPCNVPVM